MKNAVAWGYSVEWGHELRNYRAARDLSQQELAEAIGCALRCINLWESGRHQPSRRYRRVIADLVFGYQSASRRAS